MRVLVIDNYDSFVYNLVHYLEELNCHVTVVRNDRFDMDIVWNFDKILLSPGPGIPDEAGLLKELIAAYAGKKSILGVCLGGITIVVLLVLPCVCKIVLVRNKRASMNR